METNTCPTCHAPIPANAPGGFCPACLLRDAEEPSAYGHSAPPLKEIAAAFPQLEVIELIGQGGMGFVYKIRQPSLDRLVALKILSPELGRDPAFAERFAREARTLGKLHHPNIVTAFEHGKVEQAGTPEPLFYLLMEYVDGVNLRQAMRAGRFTPEQALAIGGEGEDREALWEGGFHPGGALWGGGGAGGEEFLETALGAGAVRGVEDAADIGGDLGAQFEARNRSPGVLLEVELAALPRDGGKDGAAGGGGSAEPSGAR